MEAWMEYYMVHGSMNRDERGIVVSVSDRYRYR